MEDKNTRYYIDIDLKNKKLIGSGYGDRFELIQEPEDEGFVRIYITKGQYNKLLKQKEING